VKVTGPWNVIAGAPPFPPKVTGPRHEIAGADECDAEGSAWRV
jgi:hypothetical protein